MTNTKNLHILAFGLALILLATAVYAANTVEPSTPSAFTYIQNWTQGAGGTGGSPYELTNDRGYIYEYEINETAQTNRWKAYVGNISGKLALGNGTYAIMDWNLSHVTGELYATRFHGTNTSNLGQGTSGNIMWENVACASQAVIDAETGNLSHNPATDVDALNLTFTNRTAGYFENFITAGRSISTTNCRGAFLYNSTKQVKTGTDGIWQEVVLMDTGDSQNWDLFYAVMLENNALGFNGRTYDYQILLPDNGIDTGNSYSYYFYIELSGDT